MAKKKADKTKLKRSDKLRYAAEIREMMLQGDADIDIIESLGVTEEEFQVARRFLLVTKGQEEASLSREERYARYLLEQERNVQDLNQLVQNLNSKSQYNALVGAIRLRTEIASKNIEMGQTLGVIEKQAVRSEVFVAGMQISDMANKDLKKGVISAFNGLRHMMKRYGDSKSLSDIKPGQLHHGEGAPEALVVEAQGEAVTGAPEMKAPAKGKKNKAKTGKRHAGRRRVKG